MVGDRVLARNVKAHKEGGEQRQRDHTVDAIQRSAVRNDHRTTIIEYQVANFHARGISHSGRFQLQSDPDSIKFGIAGMARSGRGGSVQDDELSSAVQEKAEDRPAVDPTLRSSPAGEEGGMTKEPSFKVWDSFRPPTRNPGPFPRGKSERQRTQGLVASSRHDDGGSEWRR